MSYSKYQLKLIMSRITRHRSSVYQF